MFLLHSHLDRLSCFVRRLCVSFQFANARTFVDRSTIQDWSIARSHRSLGVECDPLQLECDRRAGAWRSLHRALGYSATYLIDVLTFVVSLVALAAIRSMPPANDAGPAGIQSIIEGLNYARSRPELIGTYVVDMVAMTFAMPMALFPAMSVNWGGAAAAGSLYSAMSVGSLLTALLSGWTLRIQRHGAAVVVAAALWGFAIVGFGFSRSLLVAFVCLAAAGAADAVSGLFRMTIWNETIPGDLRGRLAGVEMISYLSGPLLGNARAGWVASLTSNAMSVVSGGIICVAGVLLCVPLLPAFWMYRKGK
jgi:hypothetical protein